MLVYIFTILCARIFFPFRVILKFILQQHRAPNKLNYVCQTRIKKRFYVGNLMYQEDKAKKLNLSCELYFFLFPVVRMIDSFFFVFIKKEKFIWFYLNFYLFSFSIFLISLFSKIIFQF